MEKSGFFPSINGDRKYLSSLISLFFSKIFTNGVFDEELKLVTNDNMTVTLKQGLAMINGCFYYNDSDKIFNISIADSEQSRIDNLVLRYSKENRSIVAEIIEGEYADEAIAPSLTRTEATYDLRLYKINIPKGTDKISSSNIIDCRSDVVDCGRVIQAVQNPKLTELFERCDNEVKSIVQNIQNILSTDTAGNLLNKINENTKDIGDMLTKINDLAAELHYNLISNADPIKTGRKVNGKDEYVKRIETTLNNSTQIGSNRRYEIETGLSNVKFTKPVSGFIKSSDSQLDINMVRFDGSTLSNVSHSAYLNENNCKIIFETAGYNRDGLTITADLYFIYQNEQTVEES